MSNFRYFGTATREYGTVAVLSGDLFQRKRASKYNKRISEIANVHMDIMVVHRRQIAVYTARSLSSSNELVTSSSNTYRESQSHR